MGWSAAGLIHEFGRELEGEPLHDLFRLHDLLMSKIDELSEVVLSRMQMWDETEAKLVQLHKEHTRLSVENKSLREALAVDASARDALTAASRATRSELEAAESEVTRLRALVTAASTLEIKLTAAEVAQLERDEAHEDQLEKARRETERAVAAAVASVEATRTKEDADHAEAMRKLCDEMAETKRAAAEERVRFEAEKLQLQLELDRRATAAPVSSAHAAGGSGGGGNGNTQLLQAWRKKMQEKDREIRQLKQQLGIRAK